MGGRGKPKGHSDISGRCLNKKRMHSHLGKESILQSKQNTGPPQQSDVSILDKEFPESSLRTDL